jgi:hypothetical protein
LITGVQREPFLDSELIKMISDISSSIDLSAWVTAIATLILAILTFIYVKLTRKIISSQSDPCVVLSVVHDENRPTILKLVVKNVGTGIAYDVRFNFSHPIPARAWGLTADKAKRAALMNDGPLINGIPALGPGESRKIDWGQLGGLKAAIGDSKIIAKCHFKKNGREMPPIICPLDVDSFSGTVAAESPASKTAKEIEKISKTLERLTSGFNKIKVEITSLPDDSSDEKNV